MRWAIVALPALVWISYTRCDVMSSETASLEIDDAFVGSCGDGTIGTCLGEGKGTAIPMPNARPRVSEFVQLERTGSKVELAIEPYALARVFGVGDPDVATHLLNQMARVLHSDTTKPVDPATINRALALIESIGPANASEAMTAVMLACAEHAAVEMLRRAMHPDQSPGGRALYTSLGLKATNAYAKLLEAFNRGRGKGVTQQIIVKRYTVGSGAQAVLGSVEVGRGRG
jgi:hypothetical protein